MDDVFDRLKAVNISKHVIQSKLQASRRHYD